MEGGGKGRKEGRKEGERGRMREGVFVCFHGRGLGGGKAACVLM